MSNTEKLDEARQKIKAVRNNVRARLLDREMPLLDLILSKSNGTSMHVQKQEENSQVMEALRTLQSKLEQSEKEKKELELKLEQLAKQNFNARVG